LLTCLIVLSSAAGWSENRNVLVFAAASLKTSLDEVNAQFQHETGHRVVVSYGASSTLAKQIEGGAPADVFISADMDWMNDLAERRLIDSSTRVALLGNRIVLVTPASARREVAIVPNFPLATLLGSGRLAMAEPDSVPAGRYGKAALERLGVWSSVQSRIAPAEDVRAALALVARGDVPFGIVYQTDAIEEPKVVIAGVFPTETHPPIVYPVAVLARSRSDAARSYVEYLRSQAARVIFERRGFRRFDR
jgi:molybdate transport system substrate-binding protein